ncbi:hypothetical protein PCANC_27376 [Puccinia coronata f. sp. avenae]|uniref:Uncharacterized protein n=1 Tax=Puccinia coronata f. sp. avenae TaxID=200324 RepID=A0A2N5TVC8_9BASI|nr:hypothetical protein PCANC_27376 [Puccinia coronata f. sp. avenae]
MLVRIHKRLRKHKNRANTHNCPRVKRDHSWVPLARVVTWQEPSVQHWRLLQSCCLVHTVARSSPIAPTHHMPSSQEHGAQRCTARIISSSLAHQQHEPKQSPPPTKSVEAPPPHASVAASPQPSTGIAKLKPNRPEGWLRYQAALDTSHLPKVPGGAMLAPSHSQKVQWARAKRRVTAPFAASGSAVSSGPVTRTGDANDSNKDNDANSNANSLSQHNTGSEKEDGVSDKEDEKGGTKTHIYYVPIPANTTSIQKKQSPL